MLCAGVTEFELQPQIKLNGITGAKSDYIFFVFKPSLSTFGEKKVVQLLVLFEVVTL